jgi:hypothetical protein
MELDELKQIWSQYDKKLNENLKFNEEIFKRMNLGKAKQELQKPLNMELWNIAIIFLTSIFVAAFSVKLINQPQYSVTGFAGVLIGIVYLLSSIRKAKRFAGIDYYNSTIVNLQKELVLLKTMVIRLKKIEFILLPFLIIFILPIAFKVVNHMDIYKKLWLYVLEITIILGVSYPAGIWIYKNIYDKKMKDAELFLKEIENFEKED